MTFVKLFGDYGYYDWDKEQMRLYNFRGGWRTKLAQTLSYYRLLSSYGRPLRTRCVDGYLW